MLARGIFLALVALSSPLAEAAQWAVITAGSRGFSNYRHQADACHAYNLVRSKGIPEDKIIMMAYDDIAQDTENPFPGKIFNTPAGKDVYEGCNIDYRNSEVNVNNFKAILTGDSAGVNSTNKVKKVLNSTADDHVFVYFVDHGAPGLIAFADTVMHATDLQKTFGQMKSKGMFKQLLMFLETCESGSMFEGLNGSHVIPGVYAVSAAAPAESSWGTYCGETVNGKLIPTCLGDLFSINWMQNAESMNLANETLDTEYTKVEVLTNKSHVMQWGDLNVAKNPVANFLGNQAVAVLEEIPIHFPRRFVKTTQIALQRLYDQYSSLESSVERLLVGKQMEEQADVQTGIEKTFIWLAALAYPGDPKNQHAARHSFRPPVNPECELAGHAAIQENCDHFDANTGYALHYHRVVVNICADIRDQGLNLDIRSAAIDACQKASSLPLSALTQHLAAETTVVV